MQSWPKAIKLSQPLRGATLAAPAWSVELEQRIQERERAAMERGRAEAQKLFGEQMIQQRADLIALQNGILGALKDSVPNVVRDCETHLIELALEVARKLVDDLPITAASVEAAISAAMRQVEECSQYLVYVNPADLALLEKATSSVLVVNDGRKMTVTASAEVSRGGCIVETPFGRVDARRETKFDLLKTAMLN
jgi:flagellar biosynthesis/type III secretory pathway protein FliH